ncbi:hypothetical protein V6N12_069018 [Hibiscus sabdariffa]|uniref:Uncharacterized protein n=1 Tax=Hibiscus sabdariffa TaxID=183260 RepID=A0ABR2FCL5_9ROSI
MFASSCLKPLDHHPFPLHRCLLRHTSSLVGSWGRFGVGIVCGWWRALPQPPFSTWLPSMRAGTLAPDLCAHEPLGSVRESLLNDPLCCEAQSDDPNHVGLMNWIIGPIGPGLDQEVQARAEPNP